MVLERKKRKLKDITRIVDENKTKHILALVIGIISFTTMIFGIYTFLYYNIINDLLQIFVLIAFLAFIVILISISNIQNSRKGIHTASLSLSENVVYYLDKITNNLKEVIETTDDKRKEDLISEVKIQMQTILNILEGFGGNLEPQKEFQIDLFMEQYNSFYKKLRKLLYRINGFINEKREIPLIVIYDLERLVKNLELSSTKLSKNISTPLNHAINILKEECKNCLDSVFYLPYSEKLRAAIAIKVTENIKIGIFTVLILLTYSAIIPLSGLEISDGEFLTGFIALLVGMPIALKNLLKK